MATTLTPNLKLRLNSGLTSDARYNLQRIDTLASIFQVNANQEAVIKSQANITFEPNSVDLGGTGDGGTVNLGSSGQPLASLNMFADSVTFSGAVSFADKATGGSQALLIEYHSDLVGSVDTVADRTLKIDLEGGDRELTLGGNFSVLTSNLAITAPISTSWTLPSDAGSAGDALTTDGAGTLSWTTLDTGTLTGLTDTNIVAPSNGDVLTYNGSAWISQASAAGTQLISTWAAGDGTSKTVNHGFNTRNIIIQVLDADNDYATVDVDTVTRPTDNTAELTSSVAPTSSWVILLTALS